MPRLPIAIVRVVVMDVRSSRKTFQSAMQKRDTSIIVVKSAPTFLMEILSKWSDPDNTW